MTDRRKKKRALFKRKRLLDTKTIIDYKDPEGLKRFITDRGKIIPRRVSGANAVQQRRICEEIKRARYLGLVPFSSSHRQERRSHVETVIAAASAPVRREQPREVEEEGMEE